MCMRLQLELIKPRHRKSDNYSNINKRNQMFRRPQQVFKSLGKGFKFTGGSKGSKCDNKILDPTVRRPTYL